MRCEEYLQLLSTLPVEELVDGRAGTHLESCVDCNRATRVVVERERNMMTALAGMSSHVQPIDTARTALTLARRRTVGRWYMAGLVALLLAVGITVANRSVVRLDEIPVEGTRITQLFTPRCLSPASAADLLRGFAASKTLTVNMREGSSVMTLRGTEEDLMKARAVFDSYDNPTASTCVLPQPGAPKPP